MNKRVCDYFVVAGLGENPQKLDNVAKVKNKDPITDIGVVFPELGETVPDDYVLLNETPSGLSANLNSGGIRSSECYICIRRDKNKQPLIDIGVLYDGKEQIMNDSEIVSESVSGFEANVSSSSSQKIFLTVRRNAQESSCNILVVTDVCIINSSRNELPPHSFCCTYKSLNKNMFGNEMFLCYKKSMNRPKLISYKPEVICRYPNYDLEQFAFPEIVPLFCLPMGACLECWPKDAKKPNTLFSTFVLTVSDAKEKVYGSAITFYEDFQSNCLTKKQEIMLDFDETKHTLHVHKSICILSHWPFSDSFDRFLFFLYDKVLSKRPLDIPIEKYVIQLIEEVPYPNPRTLIQLSASAADTIILTKPEDSPIPKSAARFCSLLMNLKPDNCIQLLLLALTEQKILIHSLRPDILTATVEAVSSFLFPFKWQCPYIPLCPLTLSEVLHAPLPFLIGVDSRFFDGYVLPNDINCVDLDACNITLAADLGFLTSRMLPKKATKILRNTLSRLFQEIIGLHRNESFSNSEKGDKVHILNLELEFQRRKIDQKFETRIQEAFLCFMATILKGYRSFLLPITRRPTVGTTDAEALFQMNHFLRSREKSYQKFFNMLMRTQMFIKFIEERSFVADGNLELAFFDDCIERLASDDSLTSLLTTEMNENNDSTVLLLPPEKLTPESLFVYDQFILDINLLLSLKNNNFHSKQFKEIVGSSILRRTKQEILTAKRIALKWSQSIDHWAKYLLGTCYSLYIMMLPNLLEKNVGKEKAILGDMYELLIKANKLGLYCDEVCYRIMIQLCGVHSIPLLAVKLLLLMKRSGIQPNALTYGLYNRCVLEADWPAYSSSSQLLWNKLKYVVRAIACLRKNVSKKHNNKTNHLQEDVNLNNDCDNVSNLSFDNITSLNTSNLSLSNSHSNVYKSDEHLNNNQTVSSVDIDLSTKLKNYLNFTTINKNFANDTSILRKMQKNSNSSKLMKVFGVVDNKEENVETSPTKDFLRTLVEEYDPLGALEKCKKPTKHLESNDCCDDKESVDDDDGSRKTETQTCSIISENPVLFSDAIYSSANTKLSENDGKSSRPWRPDLFSVAANVTISNFGSSIKNTLSPSSYSGKKTSELLHGGLSSLKIAANSVAKKLDEIKEAISTPSKNSNLSLNRDGSFFDPNRSCSSNTLAALDCDSIDGNDAFELNRKTTLENALNKLKDIESNTILEKLYKASSEESNESNESNENEIVMSSCMTCHNCNCLLYDEDIMANWSAEDSNLNTICINCNQSVVPLLTVYVFKSTTIQDTYRVPYLNPLVLRKELENIMVQEGEQTLCNCSFVKDHPIVFWNLLWTFERIDCDTYFPSLYVQYTQTSENSTETTPEQNSHPLISNPICDNKLKSCLKVKCIWDDPRMYSNFMPLYLTWRKTDDISSADQSIVTRSGCLQSDVGSIMCGNFVEPIQKYLNDRKSKEDEQQEQQLLPQSSDSKSAQPISVYREMLFLFVNESSGRNSNLINFDREYLLAFDKLQQDFETKKLFKKYDRPVSLSSIVCRQFFKPLTLP